MTINKARISLPDPNLDGRSDFHDRFFRLRNTDDGQLDFGDSSTVLTVVQADVESGLAPAFEAAGEGFVALDSGVMSNGSAFAVGWIYECTHVGPIGAVDDELAALPATGKTVVIEGVTLLEIRDDTALARRYVDWLLVLAQLGVATATRAGDPALGLRRTVDDARAAEESSPPDLSQNASGS